MCFLRHAEHHARNRTSLAGVEQDLLFFGPPYIFGRALMRRAFALLRASPVADGISQWPMPMAYAFGLRISPVLIWPTPLARCHGEKSLPQLSFAFLGFP